MAEEFEKAGEEAEAGRRLVNGHDEIVEAALGVARLAHRELVIYSNQLAGRFFEKNAFLESVRQLAISSPHARIRILVRNPDAAVVNAPQLMELSRQLSSSIEVRGIAQHDRHRQVTFIIADDRAVIYHPTPNAITAVVEKIPGTARHYLGVFGVIWQSGSPAPGFRQLGI